MRIVSVDVTAQNQFTEWLRIPGMAVMTIADTGAMNMTTTLQCRVSSTATSIDSDTQTLAGAYPLSCGGNLEWRAGVKIGGYTAGTATITLSY